MLTIAVAFFPYDRADIVPAVVEYWCYGGLIEACVTVPYRGVGRPVRIACSAVDWAMRIQIGKSARLRVLKETRHADK
jgi:hypothetical protein